MKFRRYAWGVVLYTLAVILWGAFVRATGSGAGCGDHWPLCNGEVIPRPETIQTWIEYFHRLSSGLSLVAVLVLWIWALKLYSKRHFVRKTAGLAFVAILLEAAIGAGLVLLKLVEHDQSMDRAISIALHLVNTLFLLASLALTALAADKELPRWRLPGKDGWMSLAVFGGFALLGALGALTALGDTLFRPSSVADGWRAHGDAASHFLERIRIWHPFLAFLWLGAAVPWMVRLKGIVPAVQTPQRWFFAAVFTNMALGALNVWLLAPVWLQILHLAVAESAWICLVAVKFHAASGYPREGI